MRGGGSTISKFGDLRRDASASSAAAAHRPQTGGRTVEPVAVRSALFSLSLHHLSELARAAARSATQLRQAPVRSLARSEPTNQPVIMRRRRLAHP